MILTESIALSLITGLVGYLIGNRLAIDRDRRREFNDLINPIRRELLSVRNHPGSNLTGAWEITFSLICERLPFWKRRAFNKTVEEYKKSKSYKNREPDGMGGFFDGDKSAIIHAVNDLLKFLVPR